MFAQYSTRMLPTHPRDSLMRLRGSIQPGVFPGTRHPSINIQHDELWALPRCLRRDRLCQLRPCCSGTGSQHRCAVHGQHLGNLIKYSSGQDLTKAIDNLNIDSGSESGTLAAQKTCLGNLVFVLTIPSPRDLRHDG